MTTKVDSVTQFVDRFLGLGMKILDVKILFSALMETLLALSSSCFPAGIEAYDDDEDEVVQTEQNKVGNEKIIIS
ncbi:Uncharacterized protein FWK35_00003323 [Aphis craccivora]|uniref:Uncharacterized protein n=1 Tax=Aphis craccivora TaxID=307492 RepID=A0A6G0ZGC0_APHCR|nr:Uncharacterized protein FWK35_00003323 [Aphis craccivora]